LNENPDVVLKVNNENEVKFKIFFFFSKKKQKFKKKPEFNIGFRIRPYCIDFLKTIVNYWDIYIFTASSPIYSDAIINYLDPEKKYINGILNRQNCMETKNGFFIKDLRIVKGKDLKKTVLVDNLAHSFGL
jgi:CTD small phosphatase-like protein 2